MACQSQRVRLQHRECASARDYFFASGSGLVIPSEAGNIVYIFLLLLLELELELVQLVELHIYVLLRVSRLSLVP